MRKLLLIGLLLAGACRSRTVEIPSTAPSPAPATGSSAAGAPSARLALDGFLAAVRAQDLQAMSSVWGDKNGPVRDAKVMTRDDMEQRELYLIRCLKHDSFRVLGDSPAMDNERVMRVELVRGTVIKATDFFLARGGDRWYVRTFALDPVKDLCTAK
ncbi:MAG: hypothetical protein ABJE10_02055 [bacterium]